MATLYHCQECPHSITVQDNAENSIHSPTHCDKPMTATIVEQTILDQAQHLRDIYSIAYCETMPSHMTKVAFSWDELDKEQQAFFLHFARRMRHFSGVPFAVEGLQKVLDQMQAESDIEDLYRRALIFEGMAAPDEVKTLVRKIGDRRYELLFSLSLSKEASALSNSSTNDPLE